MLRRVKKEVCGYLISWWFVKTFWMPIFGLHEWLKNRPRLPVLDASIIGIKVRRLASFSLNRFRMNPSWGDVDNREAPRFPDPSIKDYVRVRLEECALKPGWLNRSWSGRITGPWLSWSIILVELNLSMVDVFISNRTFQVGNCSENLIINRAFHEYHHRNHHHRHDWYQQGA